MLLAVKRYADFGRLLPGPYDNWGEAKEVSFFTFTGAGWWHISPPKQTGLGHAVDGHPPVGPTPAGGTWKLSFLRLRHRPPVTCPDKPG